ncbi:MAG: hypothetical protein ABFC28_02325 [Rikenellaceae bacterium]
MMKTKTHYLMAMIAFAGMISFTSCSDDDSVAEEDLNSETINLVKEITMTESIDEEIDASINEAIAYSEQDPKLKSATTGPECATVTVIPRDGTFPKTITIDFGNSCSGISGLTRSGSITVIISDTLRNHGAEYSVTFNNYTVEGVTVTGTKSVENTGTEDFPSFTEETNTTLTTANSIVIKKTKTITRKWVEGMDTYTQIDDVFLLSGSAEVTSSADRSYSYIITKPLKIARTCENILEGVMEITWSGKDEPVTIDFGEGLCDWKVYVSRAKRIIRRVVYLNN